MNFEVVLTCAVTGAGDTVGKSDKVPVSAKEIADDAIESAKAGATSVHIHVRDPESGKGSRDPKLFKEVVERIRNSSHDVVINLTAGMGGDWVVNDGDLNKPGLGTDMISAEERLAHSYASIFPHLRAVIDLRWIGYELNFGCSTILVYKRRFTSEKVTSE